MPDLTLLRPSAHNHLESLDMSILGDTVYLLSLIANHSSSAILTGLSFDGAKVSSTTVECEDVSRLVISNASASSVYPVRLAALHSSRQGIVDIVECECESVLLSFQICVVLWIEGFLDLGVLQFCFDEVVRWESWYCIFAVISDRQLVVLI